MARFLVALTLISLVSACAEPSAALRPANMVAADDVGIYGLVHVDGHLTDVRYRLVYETERWHLHMLRDGGAWVDVTCETRCQLRVTMKRSAQRYLDKELVAGSDAACLNNEAFAFCKVRLADGEKRFFLVALVTGDPIRLRLLPIPGSDYTTAP